MNPTDNGLLTVGMMHGGTGMNIIADRVDFSGILRSFSDTTRQSLRQRLIDICACAVVAVAAATCPLVPLSL